MFTRQRHRAVLSLEVIGAQEIRMHRGRLRDGRFQILINADIGSSINSKHTLRATLEMDGGIYFVTERPCIIVSPPPPYLGVDPPTFLRFKAKGERIQLKKGLTSRVRLLSDCQNNFLSRADRPGQFHFECNLSGVNLLGWKHPYNGEMQLKLQAEDSLDVGSEGQMKVYLKTSDETIIGDERMCLIAETPPDEGDSGRQQSRVGNIKILKVWREPPPDDPEALTWNSEGIGWNEENVGKYAVDKDEAENDLLLIYVNMDHSELVKERNRRLQVHGVTAVKTFERRYAAYVAYHLWLYCEQAESHTTSVLRDDQSVSDTQKEGPRPEAQEQEFVMAKEMQRVAKTIIQALRSERDILSEEVELD